jgi:hypothetical protein
VAAINRALRFTRKDTGGEFKNNARFELEVVIFQGWKIEFATSIRKDAEPRESKLPGCRSPL